MLFKTLVHVVVASCVLGGAVELTKADQLIWTVTAVPENSIERADVNGTNQVTVFTDTQLEPRDIALDVYSGKMYFNNVRSPGTANKIMRANLDGTSSEDLVLLGTAVPNYLALDLIGEKMYWMELQDIHRANLDGSADEVVFTTAAFTKGFAIDVSAQKMYWILEDAGDTRIRSADLDGTNDLDVLVIVGELPFAGFSVSSGRIYWSNLLLSNGQLRRVNIDGSGLTTVWTSPANDLIFRTFIDEANGLIYWTNIGTVGSLRRANIDGTGVVDLVTAPVGEGFVDVVVQFGVPGIPTISQWGLVVLGLCLTMAGTIAFARRRVAAA